jgi:hypothetical protein
MLMLGMKEKFQNCDVWKTRFWCHIEETTDGTADAGSDTETSYTSKWEHVTLMHRYEEQNNEIDLNEKVTYSVSPACCGVDSSM